MPIIPGLGRLRKEKHHELKPAQSIVLGQSGLQSEILAKKKKNGILKGEEDEVGIGDTQWWSKGFKDMK